MKTAHTFCRICEPNCPVLAELDDQSEVTALHPDMGHPYGGTSCHKGLSFLEVHNDPDRVNTPQKRLNPRTEPRGDFVEIDWDTVLTELGEKLRETLKKTY